MKLQDLGNKLSDVENNYFAFFLNISFSEIIIEVSQREGEDVQHIFNCFNVQEKYICNLFQVYQSLMSCLETIELAIGQISSYGKKDYMKKNYIPFHCCPKKKS